MFLGQGIVSRADIQFKTSNDPRSLCNTLIRRPVNSAASRAPYATFLLPDVSPFPIFTSENAAGAAACAEG